MDESRSSCSEESKRSCERRQDTRVTIFASWSAVFVAITGLWPYGYSAGSINAAYSPVVQYISKIYSERNNTVVQPDFVNAIWVIISIAFPVGGVVGCLLTEPLVSKFGRLRSILLCHIAFIVLGAFLTASKVLESPEIIVICRFGVGIFTSAITGICVMYVIEISPQHVRGIFGAMISLGVNLASLLANIIGLPQILGNDNTWNIFLALVGIASVVFLLFVRTLPESPRELYVEKGEKEKAAVVLKKLYGTEDVDDIVVELQKEREDFASCSHVGMIQMLQDSELRFSLLIAFVLAASQQITGLSCVAFNMNEIYLKAGISASHVSYASIAVLGIVVLIHGIIIPLIDSRGRKSLLLCGYGIQGISLVVLAITVEIQYMSGALAYVSVVASTGFWIGFSIGPGPVTFVMVGELFEQTSRSAAVGLSSIVPWFGMSVTASTGPYLLEAIRGYTFLLYGALSFLAVGFIYFKVPETKNRPFTEIQRLLGRRRRQSLENVQVVTQFTGNSDST